MIRVWDVESGKIVTGPFNGHGCSATYVKLSPDGRRVVSDSGDNTVLMLNVETRKIIASPFGGHRHGVNSVGFSPDGKYVVSGSADQKDVVPPLSGSLLMVSVSSRARQII